MVNKLEIENGKDSVLSLNANDSEDIKQYAEAMGLSEGGAKEILIAHQQDILKNRKSLDKDSIESKHESVIENCFPSSDSTINLMKPFFDGFKSIKEFHVDYENNELKINVKFNDITNKKVTE